MSIWKSQPCYFLFWSVYRPYPNLVVAAIVLWNTVYLERAIQALREGGQVIEDSLLQHLSPLGWEHINLTGDYTWQQSNRVERGEFRPLRLVDNP